MNKALASSRAILKISQPVKEPSLRNRKEGLLSMTP